MHYYVLLCFLINTIIYCGSYICNVYYRTLSHICSSCSGFFIYMEVYTTDSHYIYYYIHCYTLFSFTVNAIIHYGSYILDVYYRALLHIYSIYIMVSLYIYGGIDYAFLLYTLLYVLLYFITYTLLYTILFYSARN